MLYQQLLIIVFFHLFSISFQFSLILLPAKDFRKQGKRLRVRIEERSLYILPCQLILRIAPVAQTMTDKSVLRHLCLQMVQIPHPCLIVVLDDLPVAVEKIVTVCSQDTGAPPRNDIIKTSHSRHRQHIRDIAGTLGGHQSVSRIEPVSLKIQEIVL